MQARTPGMGGIREHEKKASTSGMSPTSGSTQELVVCH